MNDAKRAELEKIAEQLKQRPEDNLLWIAAIDLTEPQITRLTISNRTTDPLEVRSICCISLWSAVKTYQKSKTKGGFYDFWKLISRRRIINDFQRRSHKKRDFKKESNLNVHENANVMSTIDRNLNDADTNDELISVWKDLASTLSMPEQIAILGSVYEEKEFHEVGEEIKWAVIKHQSKESRKVNVKGDPTKITDNAMERAKLKLERFRVAQAKPVPQFGKDIGFAVPTPLGAPCQNPSEIEPKEKPSSKKGSRVRRGSKPPSTVPQSRRNGKCAKIANTPIHPTTSPITSATTAPVDSDPNPSLPLRFHRAILTEKHVTTEIATSLQKDKDNQRLWKDLVSALESSIWKITLQYKQLDEADIRSECFLSLIKCVDTFDESKTKGNFTDFFELCAERRVIGLARHQHQDRHDKRREDFSLNDENIIHEEPHGDDHEEQVDIHDELRLVWNEILPLLTIQERIAVLSVHLEGKTYKEAGEKILEHCGGSSNPKKLTDNCLRQAKAKIETLLKEKELRFQSHKSV